MGVSWAGNSEDTGAATDVWRARFWDCTCDLAGVQVWNI